MAKPSKTPTPPQRRSAGQQGPRVNLTLTPELDAILQRLSKAMGVGKASIIRGFLVEAVPQLHELARSVELIVAKQIPEGLSAFAAVVRGAGAEAQQLELEINKKRRAIRRKKVQ